MALETELPHAAALQHLWIRRAVRRMACRAAFELQRRVFENERSLFIAVALDASCIGTDSKLRLFLLEASVRIMTVAAIHRSF